VADGHGAVSRLRRVALVVLAANGLLVGLWALAVPRSFYDDFPGAGRIWIAVDGPYNEHLVRDVGGLNLALALVACTALVSGSDLVARAAGAAWLVFGVPHLVYHALNLDPFGASDAVALVVALSLTVLAGIVAVLPDPGRGPLVAGA
jgi:hypothetical protein